MRCALAFGPQDVDDGRNIMTEDLKGSVIKPSQLQYGSQTLVLWSAVLFVFLFRLP